MFDTTKHRASAGIASAFFTPTQQPGSAFDIWAEAGRATEQAYRGPAMMSQTVRAAVAVALVVMALCSVGVLR